MTFLVNLRREVVTYFLCICVKNDPSLKARVFLVFEIKRWRDKMKKGILIVSFGTTYERTRKLCIEGVESRIKDEFEDCDVRRAFTSQIVINILKKRDKLFVDNVAEALTKMKEDGFDEIYVQSLHIIPGHEYEKMLKQISDFKESSSINTKVGKPLLSDERDYERVVEALDIGKVRDDEAVVFMGHGTDHVSDESYSILEDKLREKNIKNTYIATVEGSKTIMDIVPILKEKNIKKVILKPFMLVAGDHATNDMAGDEDDSWKNILLSEGFEVETCLNGLGENEDVQEIFVSHLKDVI